MDNERRKRLLILIPSRERGGAEDYCLVLARHAAGTGWDVHAACSARAELAGLRADLNAADCAVHTAEICDVHPSGKTRLALAAIHGARTRTLLREVKPDAVVLVLCGIEFGLGSQIACATARVPTAVVFQLVPPGRRMPAYARWFRARFARDPRQHYVTVSRHNRASLAQSIDASEDRIAVIPNGVDFDAIAIGGGKDEARGRLLAELDWPDQSKLLLTVGRLDRQKGHDLVLDAAAAVIAKHPDARFVWAGDGPLRDALAARIAREGLDDRVALLGRRGDVPALLAACDLFILPTRFEGQPFSLVEAMAAGAPIVTTRASGIDEIVTHGEHALICPVDDADALEAALIAALDDPGRMAGLARNAKERAQAFSAANMCRTLLKMVSPDADSP